jgi:hypothetical protein
MILLNKVSEAEAERLAVSLAAHHEAGHAVIARVVGIKVLKVTARRNYVVPTGNLADEIRMLFAGPIATERFTKGKSWWSGSNFNGGNRDFAQAAKLAKPIGGKETEAELHKQTAKLVRKHWRTIERVARALERGTITGKELDTLLKG